MVGRIPYGTRKVRHALLKRAICTIALANVQVWHCPFSATMGVFQNSACWHIACTTGIGDDVVSRRVTGRSPFFIVVRRGCGPSLLIVARPLVLLCVIGRRAASLGVKPIPLVFPPLGRPGRPLEPRGCRRVVFSWLVYPSAHGSRRCWVCSRSPSL